LCSPAPNGAPGAFALGCPEDGADGVGHCCRNAAIRRSISSLPRRARQWSQVTSMCRSSGVDGPTALGIAGVPGRLIAGQIAAGAAETDRGAACFPNLANCRFRGANTSNFPGSFIRAAPSFRYRGRWCVSRWKWGRSINRGQSAERVDQSHLFDRIASCLAQALTAEYQGQPLRSRYRHVDAVEREKEVHST